MNYETLTYEVNADHVGILTLNRPDRLNAMSTQLSSELVTVLEGVDASEARALLITGSGRGFCAGADLADPSAIRNDKGEIDLAAAIESGMNPMARAMVNMQTPTVCAVNGIAAGAGCSLALSADLTIAARSAAFLQAFINIALVPDAGATWLLPKGIGRQRALGMAMLGEKLPAETAAEWGLIWQVVDDEALMETALATATKLANGPSAALAKTKQLINAGLKNDLETQLQAEMDNQGECGRSPEFMEGVTAFLQKRPANFKG